MRADADPLAVSAPRFPGPMTAVAARPSLAADLRELLKPGISIFVVATAAAGYLFGAASGVQAGTLLALMIGTGLTSGGSAALNHLLERRADGLMQRTRRRPIASGRVSPAFALAYGLGVLVLGLAVLTAFTNGLTALLALATAVGYVGVYTPMKRWTTMNTFVGALPGALPALGGFAAATGALGPGGWAAFAILFLWQLPHFFALAWMFREDYARGGFVMLPVSYPDGRATALVSLGAALALLVVGVVPVVLGLMGWLYFAGMLVLGTWFTLPAFSFASEPSDERARRLLLASIVYVPVFFLLVVLDFVLL
jgi:heme o synthase